MRPWVPSQHHKKKKKMQKNHYIQDTVRYFAGNMGKQEGKKPQNKKGDTSDCSTASKLTCHFVMASA
jgi:hypothetical protein